MINNCSIFIQRNTIPPVEKNKLLIQPRWLNHITCGVSKPDIKDFYLNDDQKQVKLVEDDRNQNSDYLAGRG